MSKKELRRGGEVLARVKRGELRLAKAAEVLRISNRQAKRLWRRYQKGGTAALQHGNAGRKSNRARPAKERSKILKPGGRAPGQRGPTRSASGNVAALDAGRRIVEQDAEPQAAPETARAASALWETGAVGRQFP